MDIDKKLTIKLQDSSNQARNFTLFQECNFFGHFLNFTELKILHEAAGFFKSPLSWEAKCFRLPQKIGQKSGLSLRRMYVVRILLLHPDKFPSPGP